MFHKQQEKHRFNTDQSQRIDLTVEFQSYKAIGCIVQCQVLFISLLWIRDKRRLWVYCTDWSKGPDKYG